MVQMEVCTLWGTQLTNQTFIPTIPVDTSMFALWLHHNIPQFCTDVEQVSSIMDDLCGADLMRTEDDIVS
jgi:cell cycle checkpoint protein